MFQKHQAHPHHFHLMQSTGKWIRPDVVLHHGIKRKSDQEQCQPVIRDKNRNDRSVHKGFTGLEGEGPGNLAKAISDETGYIHK